MTIVINGHQGIDELFAKLTVHEAALFLYSSGTQAHEYEVWQHIRWGIGIEHDRILAYREIDGVTTAPGLIYGFSGHRLEVNCSGIGSKTLCIAGSVRIGHHDSVTFGLGAGFISKNA